MPGVPLSGLTLIDTLIIIIMHRFHSLYAILCIPKITSQIKYNYAILYNLRGSCSGLIVSAHYTPDQIVQVGSLAGFLVSCVNLF